MEGIKRREGKDGEVQVGVDGWKRGEGAWIKMEKEEIMNR